MVESKCNIKFRAWYSGGETTREKIARDPPGLEITYFHTYIYICMCICAASRDQNGIRTGIDGDEKGRFSYISILRTRERKRLLLRPCAVNRQIIIRDLLHASVCARDIPSLTSGNDRSEWKFNSLEDEGRLRDEVYTCDRVDYAKSRNWILKGPIYRYIQHIQTRLYGYVTYVRGTISHVE